MAFEPVTGMGMKFSRGSRNFVLGFVALIGGAYAAWQGYAYLQLNGLVLRELPVTRVNLVALAPSAGYRIIVANQIAQVVEVKQGEDMQAGTSDSDLQQDTSSDGERRRLPVKDLLGALQGDLESLSRFVMVLNKIDENELPPDPVIWKSEDIEKALTGDVALRNKLEKDLNVHLDGSPLDEIRPSALEIGIVVDFPVPIRVRIGEKTESLVARVKADFIPKFSRDVMGRIQDRSEITDDTIRGTYVDEARKILNGTKPKEDIAKSVRARYAPARVSSLISAPEAVLGATSVILNDEQMKSATTSSYDAPNGQKFYNLTIGVNDEGMKRLWKYSRENRGFQVLLTVNGIPVAAPRFRNELITREVTINQLADARLAQDAADAINQNTQEGTKTK